MPLDWLHPPGWTLLQTFGTGVMLGLGFAAAGIVGRMAAAAIAAGQAAAQKK